MLSPDIQNRPQKRLETEESFISYGAVIIWAKTKC